MPIDLQYDVVNYTPADASPVESNFNRLQQYINTDLINKDGSVAMAAQLKLIGNPVAALDAVPKQYVDTFVPIGSILLFGGSSAPAGGQWALCNGADLAQTDFPNLFAVIGVTYGGASGYFKLPNLTQKFPMGVGSTKVIGATGGSSDGQVVSHTHNINHAHALGTTSNDSQHHSHQVPDHLHGVSIQSGGQSAQHAHTTNIPGTNFVENGPPGSGFTTGGPGSTFHESDRTAGYDTDHSHGVNGATQGSGAINTGGVLNNHTHPFQTPAYTGASGDASNAAVDANLPPYVVVNFIIRCA